MVVYVDDILMVAKRTDAMQLWAALDRNVKFKDAAEEIGRYLGANYEYSRYDPKQPNAIRTVSIDMDGYATDATARFERELLEREQQHGTTWQRVPWARRYLGLDHQPQHPRQW